MTLAAVAKCLQAVTWLVARGNKAGRKSTAGTGYRCPRRRVFERAAGGICKIYRAVGVREEKGEADSREQGKAEKGHGC